MKLNNLNEGLFDLIRGKKKVETKMMPLTPDQRGMIQSYFNNSNAGLKFGSGPDSKYVLELNAHASHGKGRISFRNESGALKASVAYHKSKSDVGNPKASPLIHYDVDLNNAQDFQKLIKELD
jgi:hypothetical protein